MIRNTISTNTSVKTKGPRSISGVSAVRRDWKKCQNWFIFMMVKESKAIVVGVAIDFPSYGYAKKSKVIALADEHLIDFAVLLSDPSISEKIGAGMLSGLPTTYLYTPKGELVVMQLGGITRSLLEAFINKHENRNSTDLDIPDK